MTATSERQLKALEMHCALRESELIDAQYYHRVFKIAFMAEALAAGKDWAWMAERMDITESAARRYYQRHRLTVSPKDFAIVQKRFGIHFYNPGEAI
jgi:hypothetical protein